MTDGYDIKYYSEEDAEAQDFVEEFETRKYYYYRMTIKLKNYTSAEKRGVCYSN